MEDQNKDKDLDLQISNFVYYFNQFKHKPFLYPGRFAYKTQLQLSSIVVEADAHPDKKYAILCRDESSVKYCQKMSEKLGFIRPNITITDKAIF